MSLYRELGFNKRRHAHWSYLYHVQRVREAVILGVFIVGFALLLAALVFCT
jgi:hypothetical protein